MQFTVAVDLETVEFHKIIVHATMQLTEAVCFFFQQSKY